MATTLAHIQQRRKTAAAWTSSNEVLLASEIGVETDTGKWKLGDGSTAWASLGYQAGTAASLSATSATLWKANTAYAAGQAVVNPTGSVVTATTGFTSGSTYDASKWTDALTQRTGTLSLVGDFATDNKPLIAAAFTLYDYVSIVPDATGNVIGTSGTIFIPAGKTLEVHSALTIKAFATNASSYLIRLSGDRARLLCKGTLDGNLAARDTSGALAKCCWGVVAQDVSDTYTEVDRAVNFGKTAASPTLDGGAALLYKSSAATAHVTNNVMKVRRILGTGLNGFMMRILSDFTGLVESDSAYYNQYNEIYCPQGSAGNKNCVEVCGPNTRFNDVHGGVAFDPTGYGGFEADFGAYNNTFHGPTVVFSPGTTLTQSFDAFSQRTTDQGDSKPKISRGNRFVRPRLIGGTLTGAYNLQMFNVTCGTDAVFEYPQMMGASVGSGTGYLNMLGLDTSSYKVDRVRVIRPNVQDVQNGIRQYGANGSGAIEVEGGRVTYGATMLNLPSNTTMDRLTIRDMTLTGTTTALTLAQVMISDVTDNEFVGQVSDTISAPTMYKSVLRFGRNIFRCGSSSGFPVSIPGGSGFVMDQGGNVYTVRVPGAATNGSAGRARASGANVLSGTLASPGAEQQAIVRVTAQPTAGTWAAGDEWQHPAPVAAGVPGGYAVGSGTFGTYSSTATTTTASNQVTVADATGLKLGDWVSVAGAVAKGRVDVISGTTLTLSVNATASVTSAAIAHIAPSWKAKPAISA